MGKVWPEGTWDWLQTLSPAPPHPRVCDETGKMAGDWAEGGACGSLRMPGWCHDDVMSCHGMSLVQ